MPPLFEWDENKARLNLRKHRVTFIETVSVFEDPLARIFDDPAHSSEESREIIIGHSIAGRLLLDVSQSRLRTRFGLSVRAG